MSAQQQSNNEAQMQGDQIREFVTYMGQLGIRPRTIELFLTSGAIGGTIAGWKLDRGDDNVAATRAMGDDNDGFGYNWTSIKNSGDLAVTPEGNLYRVLLRNDNGRFVAQQEQLPVYAGSTYRKLGYYLQLEMNRQFEERSARR